ncbi:MAG: SDR family NAD(P)-dependent oxidoreductase, partial [Alphaproteobacteria bacterium]|nr:SDR family NAD(P)-dependent oxidoreductase [Alphaproteobacteria bacterium]
MLPIDLGGRVALVTASSRGIGRGIALMLAQAGARLVVTWAADRAAGEETAAEIEKLGGQAMLAH